MGDWVPEFAEVCYICKTKGTNHHEETSLIVCDGCDYEVVHYQCLKLPAIPQGDWFCPSCEVLREQSHKAERRQRRKMKKIRER